MNAQSWTLSIIALYTVIVLPYLYAKRLGMEEPLATIPLNLAAYLLLTPTELYTSIPSTWLGHAGMFSVFIITFLVVRFIKICQDHNVTIKMPQGVPHYIEATFAVLIPAAIIVFACSLIGQLMTNTSYGSIHQMIYTFIQTPLMGIGTSFIGLLVTEIMMTLAMFCGIHGSSVAPYADALQIAANEQNAAALAAGEAIPNIYGTGLLNSIQAGGIGATLGFCIIMVIFAKAKRYKQLSRIAIIPQIFNIGEPLLFGVPIMLNPLLFIPYMGGVIMNTIVSYGAIALGIVSRCNGVNPSWTMPYLLQGLLTFKVPWQGFLLQVVILIMDMAIWYPFFKIIDKQAVAEEQAEEAA
jgi:PTS system cellobiose-specific IIC component